MTIVDTEEPSKESKVLSKSIDILTVLKRLAMKIVGLENLSKHCCSKNWPSYADVYIVIYVHVAQISIPEPVGPGPAKSIKISLPHQNVDISLVQSLLSGRMLLFNCSTPRLGGRLAKPVAVEFPVSVSLIRA
jgi:hypothetical protein